MAMKIILQKSLTIQFQQKPTQPKSIKTIKMNMKMFSLSALMFLLAVNAAFAQNSSGTCPAPKPKYLNDPNAYPSLQMGRYQFIRAYFGFLRFLAQCYYSLVNAAFALLNAFKPVEHVQWTNASSLLFIPALKAAEMIRQRQLSSHDLVNAYIDRIKAVNPLVNAIHQDNFANALQQADQVDQQIANMSNSDLQSMASSKPLLGVPFTSKANLNAIGFVTSACNQYLMKNSASNVDAPIVANAKAAGAILIAITAMPNLGLSWAGDDTACGQVNNPHDVRRIPGGSSSGEGAIIAAGGSLFGFGNDIGGSVREPAHMSGVFGLKPTNYPGHTISVDGIVPNFVAYQPAADMLSNGPLVRYASDMHVILSMMAGKPLDYYNKTIDFTSGNFKLYYIEDHDILITEPLHDEQRDVVRMVKSYFEQTYNMSVQKVKFPLMNRMWELWGINGWTDGLIDLSTVSTQFQDIWNGVANTTFLELEFDLIKAFNNPKDEKQKAFALEKLAKFRRQVSDLLGDNALLLTPAWPTPQPFHNMEPFTSTNLIYTMTWNLLGNPAVTTPVGKSPVTNMPLGVQFVANSFNEALLVGIAREMEKAFGGWVKPGNVPKELLSH